VKGRLVGSSGLNPASCKVYDEVVLQAAKNFAAR
jgi:hypothetical protein